MVIISWFNENTGRGGIGVFEEGRVTGPSIRAIYRGTSSSLTKPFERTKLLVHSKNLWQWETDNAD